MFSVDNIRHCLRLMDTVLSGWHTIVSPGPRELMSALPEPVAAIYGEFILASASKATHSPLAYVTPIDCQNCDAERVVDFLAAPTALIVENPTTDGAFITNFASMLVPRLQGLLKGRRAVVQVLHGGGIGEIPKEIARVASARPPRVPGLPPRVVVVADSDAAGPGAMSAQARAVLSAASQHAVEAHILYKRSIENYFPDEVLELFSRENTDAMSACSLILALPDEARDFYPMKRGLPDPLGPEWDADIFGALPAGEGCGDFAAYALSGMAHTFSAEGLARRDHNSDLLALLGRIERNC